MRYVLPTGKQEKPAANDKVLVCVGIMMHADLFQELQTTNCKTLVRIDTGTQDSAFEKKNLEIHSLLSLSYAL